MVKKTRSALYLVPLLVVAAAAGYLVSRQLARDVPSLAGGTLLPQARQLPAFSLTDHTGAVFTNAQLEGRASLVFFGFTHCPDICPATLALMTQLVRQPALAALRPVFVSVDPQRDDVTAMSRYVNAFGGNIIGLRGEEADLAPLLQGLLVAHGQQPLPGGGYTVDHSSALYFLDERGHWTAVFTPPFDPATLQQDLTLLLAGGR